MIIQFLISLTQLKVSVGIVGLYRRSFPQRGYGQIPLPLKVIDDAKIVIRKKFLMILSYFKHEFLDGLVDLFLALVEEIGNAKIVVGPGKVFIKRDRLFKFLSRIPQQT